jgi:CPA1 family monovalent cation:H+ antiporter
MIHFLKLGRQAQVHDELEAARRSLAEAAFERLEKEGGAEAEAIRTICKDHWTVPSDAGDASPLVRRRKLTIAAVIAQRQRLEELRDKNRIGPTQYLELQEDLDWKQLSVGSDEDRRITES